MTNGGAGTGRARRLPLQGVVNFRDLGGYETQDGRSLRWGLLFRSDMLADLTDTDVVVLTSLGLRTICDLRGPAERAQKPSRALRPDRAPEGTEPVAHPIGFMPHGGDELLALTRVGGLRIPEIETRVREIYRRFVTDQTATFARLLTLAETADLPMLIHCTSGRDRTGFASAVILMALGVSRETITGDYLLSNHHRRDLTFQIGAAVDVEVMTALTNAHPTYLQAAFAAIDAGWGSDAAYLRDGLGFDAEKQTHLKNRMLAGKEQS